MADHAFEIIGVTFPQSTQNYHYEPSVLWYITRRWRRQQYVSLQLCWLQQSRGYIPSMIAPCYVVMVPDTHSIGQHNVTWGHLMKKKSVFPFFLFLLHSPNWHKLDPDFWFGFYLSIVTEKREEWNDQEMAGQWVHCWVVEEGSSISGSLNIHKLHWCDQICAPCLYAPFEWGCLGNTTARKNAGK